MRPTLLLLALLAFPTPLPAQPPTPQQELVELVQSGATREAFKLGIETLLGFEKLNRLGISAAADFEFTLVQTGELAKQLGESRRFAETLERVRSQPGLGAYPLLQALLQYHLAEHWLNIGASDKAQTIYDQLGTVTKAWMLGPLDNERGNGFRRKHRIEKGPEHPLDLKAKHQGKARKVAWRLLDIGFAPERNFDFDSLIRPTEQVLTILAFSARVEQATPVSIRLGCSGSTRILVNGQKLFQRDAESRAFGFDQDVATAILEPGDNLILIKSGCQEDIFQLRVRLTDPSGAPLPAKRVILSCDPERMLAASKAAASKRPIPESAMLPSERLLKRLKGAKKLEGAARARAGQLAYRLAFLLKAAAREEETQRRDRAIARLATQLRPEDSSCWKLYGDALESERWSGDRDDNPRYAAYERAVTLWPRAQLAMLALAGMELESRSNHRRAWMWLESARAVRPDGPDFLESELALMKARELDKEAHLRIRSALLEGRHAHFVPLLAKAIPLAKGDSRYEEALALLQRRRSVRDSLRTRIQIARMQLRLGQSKAAFATLAQAELRFPWEQDVYEVLAEFYRARALSSAKDAAKMWAQAERAWMRFLALCPEDVYSWLMLAEIAAQRGDVKAQVTRLKRALALKPGLTDAARRLDFLSSEPTPFYEGLELDSAALLKADPGPSPESLQAKRSHEYILQHSLIRAYSNGTSSRYEHKLVRILTERGAQIWSSYSLPIHSGSQLGRILEARVIKPNGRSLRARLGQAWYIQLPKIDPGDIVELKLRVDDQERSFFGDYFGLEHSFLPSDGAASKLSRLDVLLEKGRSYYFQSLGAVPQPRTQQHESGAELRSWVLRDLPGRDVETRAPSSRETGPLLRISTYRDWNQFAAWWWDLIRKQTTMTPAIRAHVQKLVRGAKSKEEQLRRIYEFVTNRIRYEAWEFGVHGYKPYSIETIYERRHGDCKDKAILMNAMLAEVGIKAYPVLILAEEQREKDDLSLPLIEHFNHCISYVPTQDGLSELWLDGTADRYPLGVLPEMDYGADLLVVQGHEGKIKRIPWPTPEDNCRAQRFDVRLLANGDAIVEMDQLASGFHDPTLRHRWANEPGKRQERLQDQLGRIFGKIEIEDMQFSKLEDLSEPARYQLRFRVPGLARLSGGAQELRLVPIFSRQNLSALASAETRKKDILLTPPESRQFRVRITPPKGWRIAESPKKASFDAPFASFAFTSEVKKGSLEIASYYVRRRQRISAAEYKRFLDMTRLVDRAENQELLLVKEGKK